MNRRHTLLKWSAFVLLLLGVALLVFAEWGYVGVYIFLQAYAALASTTFTVVYHVTARWWETIMGRNIMLLIGSIAAVLDLGLFFNLLGRPDWMRVALAFAFAVVGTAIWRRLTILIDAQYPDR
jgi:hypothetical protein